MLTDLLQPRLRRSRSMSMSPPLIVRGADLEAPDKDGAMPLFLACMKSSFGIDSAWIRFVSAISCFDAICVCKWHSLRHLLPQ
jgi:hypothetical protein